MYRDPLYWQIRRRLRELKDGNAFELCANDLLRKLHPSLAPREGGDDAGLDGKIVHVTDTGNPDVHLAEMKAAIAGLKKN